MRADMFKVIVERPRRGVGYFRTLPNDYRAAKHFKLDDELDVVDEFWGTQPMRNRKIGWERKELNENLNPLYRFLKKQVGRPWNEVYSEISENLDTGSTVKQHVRDHLKDFVALKTYVDADGDRWLLGRYGPSPVHYKELFVDEHGILRNSFEGVDPSRKYRSEYAAKAAAERFARERIVDEWHRFEKINGFWFFVTFGPLPEPLESYQLYFWRDALGNKYSDIRYGTAYRAKIAAIAKRSANSREIAQHGLN